MVDINTPGATRSISGPKLLPQKVSPSQLVGDFRSSQGLLAPTAIVWGNAAGKSTTVLSFPAAKKTGEPSPPRPTSSAY